MPQYLSPGVYVEEVASGASPIAGVGTSTAGFIGVSEAAEVGLNAALLVGRKLARALSATGAEFAAGTAVTAANVDGILTALKAKNASTVKVKRSVRPTKTALKGMTLDEAVKPEEGEEFPAGTSVTDDNDDAIIAGLGDQETVRVKGPVRATKENLLGTTLDEEVAQAGPTTAAGTEITADNVESIIQAAGGARTILVEPAVALETPQLITSFGDFTRLIAGFSKDNAAQNLLAHGVYGFFNNGGTRCWVARVAGLAEANVGSVRKALQALGKVDEIAIVAAPGALDQGVQGELLDHCENAQDRFAILDGQRTRTLTVDEIQGGLRTSNYAAMYFPWIEVFDPATGGRTFVSPGGHVAGIYARVDTARGVHKAPANEVIRGALGVEARLGRPDQDGLNPLGINVIRQFDGNVTVWGARTLGGDANGEWKYINVRRLFLFLRESIEEGTQWVVFEPNDMNLWAKITRNVTAFLTNVWRSGALFGASPEEAFFVKCDAETNPPELRDLGQVITEIGVAVVKPAEFVIFRISQWAGPGQ